MENLFKKENCCYAILWDYNGYNESLGAQHDIQKDWNQTIMTRMNEIGAYIFSKSNRSGADTVRMHSKFTPLIDSLEYYRFINHKIASRYNVVFDDSINEDIIYVYNSEILDMKLVFINIDKDGNRTELSKVSSDNKAVALKAIIFSDLTKEEQEQEIRNRMGYIQIDNFN